MAKFESVGLRVAAKLGDQAVASMASLGMNKEAASDGRKWGPVQEWRPIESAPKDGTLILLWCRFIDRGEPHVARYVEPNGRPGDFGEFCWSTYSDGKGEIAERIPTHWMPLPEPPHVP